MFTKKRKLLTSSVIFMLTLSLLSGCGGSKSAKSNLEIDEKLASDDFKYPIEGNVELSYRALLILII